MNCRNTRLCFPAAFVAGVAVITSMMLSSTLAGASPAPTITTPSSSQISATQAQVAALEATISHQQQQTEALDQQYLNAEQALENAQAALQTTAATITTTEAQLKVEKQRLASAAINAYVYATPVTRVTDLFTTSATKSDAQTEYQDAVVGNLSQASNSLAATQAKLTATLTEQQAQQQQAAASASQAKTIEAQNVAATNAAEATLQQVKGTLAQQVAAAAAQQAQQAAAAAAAAKTAAAAKAAAAKAAAAATVASAVGSSSTAAAATTSANQASTSAAVAGSYTPTIAASETATSAGLAAVAAAKTQVGVPYVFGGETPGVGFDCSGLTQWAWAQAGVSIPRTSETQDSGLTPVPEGSPLEPGDILFYYNLDNDNLVDHVVMYIGNGQVISAPETGRDVYISPIFYYGLVGAGRP